MSDVPAHEGPSAEPNIDLYNFAWPLSAADDARLTQAGHFHAEWTPRGWSNSSSRLVGFEQLLYLGQPGYGPSYIVGKLQLDHLLALASHRADFAHRPFVARNAFDNILASGIVPPTLIEAEVEPNGRP